MGGWVFRFIPYTVYLPYPSFSRCQSCIKIIPRREAKRVSRKGKKKIFDNLKFTIMHSRIFQISTEPIDKENYLNE
ncbi:hypothetical protein GKG12_28095, partial [Escherichia coli]|nr:hypothetical protein [Escherichia coli]